MYTYAYMFHYEEKLQQKKCEYERILRINFPLILVFYFVGIST